ncbi:hypothetical protein D3C85_656240 [compost metagenome]
MQRLLHVAQAEFILAHRQEQLVDFRKAQLLRQRLKVDGRLAFALQGFLHQRAAVGQGFLHVDRVEPGADLRARARADGVAGAEPVARRPGRARRALGRDDFAGLAVFQLGIQGHHDAVDLGAAAAVAHVRVQVVGKIDGRGAHRQLQHARLRRHDEDAVVQGGGFQLFHPLALDFFLAHDGVGHFRFPGQQLAQPGDLFVVFLAGKVRAALFLVAPVRGHAVFGKAVHFIRADLHFQRTAILGRHHRVQRLVTVGFRPRNVIVEFFRDGGPDIVDHAQHRVAGFHVGNDDAEGTHVIQGRKIELLAAHLVPDAVNVFRAAKYFRLDTGRSQFRLQAQNRGGNKTLAHHALFFQHLGDAFIRFRFDEAERQVFQFPLQLPDTEAVGQRRVQIQSFLAVLTRHFVEQLQVGKVTQGRHAGGQAHQHDTHVGSHRQQHLAQGFHLGHGLLRRILAAPASAAVLRLGQRAQADQLAHACCQVAHLLAEARFDVGRRIGFQQGQLEHQAGDARFRIAAQESQGGGHADGELQRGAAGKGLLVAICFGGIRERVQHARAVRRTQALYQLFRCGAIRGRDGNHVLPLNLMTEQLENLTFCSDDDDFNQACRIGQFRFHRGARRRVAGGDPVVPHFIHAGEILHVGDVDLARQDASLVAARFHQQTVDVAQHFARLADDALRGVFRDLASQVDGVVVYRYFGEAFAYVQSCNFHASSFGCFKICTAYYLCYLPSKNLRAMAIWSSWTKVGAWPTPAISTSSAFGPRPSMRVAVSCDSKSDSEPRTSRVGQRTASYAAHSMASSLAADSGVAERNGMASPIS